VTVAELMGLFVTASVTVPLILEVVGSTGLLFLQPSAKNAPAASRQAYIRDIATYLFI
jgi:hypothetical protein